MFRCCGAVFKEQLNSSPVARVGTAAGVDNADVDARTMGGEMRSLVAKTFPLSGFGRAQEAFLTKALAAKLVLIPPE